MDLRTAIKTAPRVEVSCPMGEEVITFEIAKAEAFRKLDAGILAIEANSQDGAFNDLWCDEFGTSVAWLDVNSSVLILGS
jgi:hypothetical protein